MNEEFEKLIIEGPDEVTRGFIIGWTVGRGMSLEESARCVLWPREWDIQIGSALDGLVEALRPGECSVALVQRDLVTPLFEAMQPWEGRLHLRLRSRHRIQGAFFDFRYEIFDRKEATKVRAVFENLPEGVAISDSYKPEEEIDRSARGAEMYAPTHHYVCRAHGTVGGHLRGVLEVHERARHYQRIQIKDVKLRLEP